MNRPTGPTDTGLGIDAWAQDALATLTGLPGVRRAGLALTEGGGRRLRFTASDRHSGAGVAWCHVDAYDDVPLNTAVRSGKPVTGSLDELAESYAGFVERQRGTATLALTAAPLVSAGQVLGGFVLFLDRLGPAQPADLAGLGADLGAALRRAQRGELRPKVPLPREQVPPGAVVAEHEVAPDPAAVAGARRFLRDALHEWGIDDDTTDTAVLCLSELVTNAVVHAHAGCDVRALLDAGVLTTSVRDGGAAAASPAEPHEDPLRVHGRGLQLVDALANRWGSELDSVGTTVWFVLEPGVSSGPEDVRRPG